MSDLSHWFEIPALCDAPFLAINLSNRDASTKHHNDALLQEWKTGHWPIPKAALAAGIEGKIVVLYYAASEVTTIYTGRCKTKNISGKTKHDRPRFLLTMTQAWRIEGSANTTFTEFFSDFRMSSNPTVVWADADTYSPPGDVENAGDPDDDGQNGVTGNSIMALVAIRARHNLFVKRVQKVWGKQCALTGLEAPRLVQACHIVPWSVAKPVEQTSGNNGLMLCAHLHALLDSHLLSFGDDGHIMLEQNLDGRLRELVLSSQRTHLRKIPSSAQIPFLQRHREAAAEKGHRLVRVE